MKKIALLLMMLVIGLPMAVNADNGINITPLPMRMTAGNGKLTLPQSFTILAIGLENDQVAEATKFGRLISNISGYQVSIEATSDGNNIQTRADVEYIAMMMEVDL